MSVTLDEMKRQIAIDHMALYGCDLQLELIALANTWITLLTAIRYYLPRHHTWFGHVANRTLPYGESS